MGNSVKIVNAKAVTKTFKCPMVFESIADVQLLAAYGIALKNTVNWVLNLLSEHLFERLEIVCGEKRDIISLWDLYAGFKTKDAPTINGKTINKSVSSYVTREIMNSKASLFGVSTIDVIHYMEDELERIYNTRLVISVRTINECIYNKVDSMMKGFVGKKLNDTKAGAARDRTWENICRDVTREICHDDIAARKLAYQMEKIGVHLSPVLSGEMPEAPKWNKNFSIKVGKTEKVPVPEPDMNDGTLISAYTEALNRFIVAVSKEHPVLGKLALVSVPSATFDIKAQDKKNYYDLPGVLNQVPTLDNKHKVRVHVRMQSGHSDRYYPATLDGLAGCAKISFRIPENWESGMVGDGSKKVEIDAMAHIPVKVNVNETAFTDTVDINDGIGIDLNLASFFMNTTVPVSRIRGGVDWIEAIRAFHEECPDAWMFSDKGKTGDNVRDRVRDEALGRMRRELLSLAARAD